MSNAASNSVFVSPEGALDHLYASFPALFFEYALTCKCLSAGIWVCVRDDSTSSQTIMQLIRKCCQIMQTPQPGALNQREAMSGRGSECVCALCI